MVSAVSLLGEQGIICEGHCSPEGVTSTPSMGMGTTTKQIEATLAAYFILLCQPKTKRNKQKGEGITSGARRVWVDTRLKQSTMASQVFKYPESRRKARARPGGAKATSQKQPSSSAGL